MTCRIVLVYLHAQFLKCLIKSAQSIMFNILYLCQIKNATIGNANILLQIDNSKLAADDFKTK